MDTLIYPSDDLRAIQNKLSHSPWLIACLCAAWCDTCQAYRKGFDSLQNKHQSKCFAWIDIEDHADLINDLDIENFPTILIQYQDKVLFLGTMLPDFNLVHRLIESLEQKIAGKELNTISSTIQQSNYPLPSDWSLRKSLESTLL